MFVFPIWIPACCIAVGLGVPAQRLRARPRERTARAGDQAPRDSAGRRIE